MEERNITVTLEKAREWFSSGDATLKEPALQAFSKDELADSYKRITTFKDACESLRLNYDIISIVTKDIATYSRASAAMFKLNIIRKAINLGYDLSLTKDPENSHIYYPSSVFIKEDSNRFKNSLNSGRIEVIGKIRNEGTLYKVLSGASTNAGTVGLGSLSSNVCYTDANIGFFGCATKEIAAHFGKYFGMLITEAKYADMVDFEITEDKYRNTEFD